MPFRDLKGHRAQQTLLARALMRDALPQSLIFAGPDGVGKRLVALSVAQRLNCLTAAPDEGDACGTCSACRRIASGTHPDVLTIQGVSTLGEKKVDAVREQISAAAYRPFEGRRRVFIIDDADRMTEDAPQAILKFLEEPAPGTVIILVLSRVRAVPATVISRCQVVRFRARAAVEGASAVAEAAALIDEVREGGPPALFKKTERMDRERAEGVIDGCWLLCRELLLARAGAPATLLTDAAHAEARATEAAYWTDERLLAAIEVCREAREALVYNVAPRLTIDMLLSRLARRAA